MFFDKIQIKLWLVKHIFIIIFKGFIVMYDYSFDFMGIYQFWCENNGFLLCSRSHYLIRKSKISWLVVFFLRNRINNPTNRPGHFYTRLIIRLNRLKRSKTGFRIPWKHFIPIFIKIISLPNLNTPRILVIRQKTPKTLKKQKAKNFHIS